MPAPAPPGAASAPRGTGPRRGGENCDLVARRFAEAVRRIPRGRVATYGQIAFLSGRPRNARQVGSWLRALPDDARVPWHRVLNAGGRISPRAHSVHEGLQRVLLEREGVSFDPGGRVDLRRYGWQPALAIERGRKPGARRKDGRSGRRPG